MLSAAEKQLVLDVPSLITLLIGGADGKVDHNEEGRAKRAVTFRSHTGDPFLFEYYAAVELQFESRLAYYLLSYDNDPEIRTKQISDELAKLTPILAKIEKIYAKSLLANWKNLAKVLANETGGFLGYFSISSKETHLISLQMIQLRDEDPD